MHSHQSQRKQDDAVSVKSHLSHKSQASQKSRGAHANNLDDAYSQASSKAPASVYYMEGDEEDEWATLVK